MPWTCPDCGQTFRNRNQAHTCQRWDLSSHFRGRRAAMRPLFDAIREAVVGFGEVDVRVLKSEIVFARGATFAGVRVRPSVVELLFYLDHVDDEPPVARVHDVSRNRVIHQVLVTSRDELTPRVIFLVRQAYDLVGHRRG